MTKYKDVGQRNPYSLLVGVYTGAAPMQINIGVSQAKTRSPTWPSCTNPGHSLRGLCVLQRLLTYSLLLCSQQPGGGEICLDVHPQMVVKMGLIDAVEVYSATVNHCVWAF